MQELKSAKLEFEKKHYEKSLEILQAALPQSPDILKPRIESNISMIQSILTNQPIKSNIFNTALYYYNNSEYQKALDYSLVNIDSIFKEKLLLLCFNCCVELKNMEKGFEVIDMIDNSKLELRIDFMRLVLQSVDIKPGILQETNDLFMNLWINSSNAEISDPKQSVQYLQRYKELISGITNPDLSCLYNYNLGTLNIRMGKPNLALVFFEKALEYNSRYNALIKSIITELDNGDNQ
ncbi:hypothetical protein HDV04_004437 [Boothiomyces sp. JEL0838]|nr:hypothetical protein HDV04_004437 [Boothiomyces sp. JEL0838]